jgi:pimeloyl-ACP methyl ester carboxylesterase
MFDPLTQFLTTVDGRTLCYADWGAMPGGSPAGYPLFSLHGSAGSRLLVRAPELIGALGARLITYDRPGYGRSDRRGPGTSVNEHVADVEAVADALGIEEFAITGGSGGGPHALAVAARLPHRVSRASDFAALAPYDLMGHDDYVRDQDDWTRDYLAKVRESEATCAVFFKEMDDEMRAGLEADDPMRAALLEQCREGVMGWVDDERALQAAWGFDLGDISVPTVVYANVNDPTTPPNHAEWLVDHIPGAVLISSTNANAHGTEIPDPDKWRRALYAWLVQGGEPAVP